MEEEKETPAFIRIVKDTEMFKRGGVFRNYSSFWAPEDAEEAFNIHPYSDDYIRPEHGIELLKRGIAVPVVKFTPEFVTEAENKALQEALINVNKKGKK